MPENLLAQFTPRHSHMKWVTFVICLCSVCAEVHGENQWKQQELNFNHTENHIESTVDQVPGLEDTEKIPEAVSADRPLNVLLLSVPSMGHLNPLLALGEELGKRGHNVTLCLPNEAKFSERIRNRAAQFGIRLVVTGQSSFKTALEGVDAGTKVSNFVLKFPSILGSENEIIVNFLETFVEQNKVDILIGDNFMMVAVVCASLRHKIPAVFMFSSLLVMPQSYPAWPWPGPLLGSLSDDLTFLQRFLTLFEWTALSLFQKHMIVPQLNKLRNSVCHSLSPTYIANAAGTYLPQIVPSVIGIEYPRTISPLTHYVGPVLTKSPEALPTSLQVWLNSKQDKSVIYISMGSHMSISKEVGKAVAAGITVTNYSAVWALRNRADILDGHKLPDQEKMFITEWAPQLSIMGHRAVRMAILHGGANGIHESLYNEIPVIVLPHFGDQVYMAGRISHNGLGVYVSSTNISAATISEAIEEIDSKNCTQNVKQLKKIFFQAGGVERAADLVEYYEDVGYAHLVPAYAKYDWSLIQYYNIDVYLLLSALLTLLLYISYTCCKCTCKKFCMCFHNKIKVE